MTVTTINDRASYTGDGTSTAFPFPYYFLAATDIVVYLNSTQQLGGFTVTGAGNPLGGTVNFTTAPGVGVSVLLVRDPDLLQSTDLPPNDPFPSDAVERALDKLTMIAQAISANEDRTVHFPLSETVDGELPLSGDRANKMYGFDANGVPTVLPMPSSIGAGDLRWEKGVDGTRGFKTGADFTPGVTAQLTLSRSPVSDANVWVYWDGVPQTDFSISNGNQLNFPTAIPDGISVVDVRVGTTLSLNIPAQQSVGADQLVDGAITDSKISSSAKIAKLTVSTRDLTFYSLSVSDGDWAPAIWEALDDMPSGSTIEIPWFEGGILVNSARNGAVWDFTPYPNKAIRIVGKGWSLKNGGSFTFGSDAGPMGSVFRMGANISDTTDFYHQAPTDLIIGGVGFHDFAVVANTGAYGTPRGRNAFNIDGTAATNGYIENLLMEDLFIDNMATGSSILVNGIGNAQGVLAGAVFRSCKFMNFYAPGFGDSNTIEHNVIGANAGTTGAVGINFYNVSGATNTRILNNDMVNFNGMILCNGATKMIIDGNEFEQPAGFANTLGAMISLNGANGTIDAPTITNNSIAQNSAVANYVPIVIGNSLNAKVGANRISTLANYAQIQINSNSSYTRVDADNLSWVNGVAQDGISVQNSGVKSMLLSSPWSAYTPTVSASSGAFTTVTATGAWQMTDTRTLSVRISIVITTVGTAAGSVSVSLPTGFTAAALETLSGREIANTGKGLSCSIVANAGSITVTDAAGVSIISAGNELVITGQIEIQ